MSRGSKILFVRETFPWMGRYSGYDLICEKIPPLLKQPTSSIFKTDKKIPIIPRLLLKPFYLSLKKSQTYTLNSLRTEINCVLHAISSPPDITHVLYVERTLSLLSLLPRRLTGLLVGTVHQPSILWLQGRHQLGIIKSMDGLIVLSKKEKEFFLQILPDRVFFIPHGIDTNFFKPANKKNTTVRCLFSGTWLRDLKTLANIVQLTIEQNPSIQYDLLIPENKREQPDLETLRAFEQVHWHSGLTDEQLLTLYQQATMLILPLMDCTANNALLEAMACGLPILTNKVGGTTDYTNASFAELFPVGEVDGFVRNIIELANNPHHCHKRGEQARKFAEQNFNWDVIRDKTIDLYTELINNPRQGF
jgi:glycosyltransferase involved in cell wall biosynthesis